MQMVQDEVCNSKEVLCAIFFFFFLTERIEASLSFQDYFIQHDKSRVYFLPTLWNVIFPDPDEILVFLVCVEGRGGSCCYSYYLIVYLASW